MYLANFIKQSSTTTGTGTYTLGAAVTGFQAIPAAANGLTLPYSAFDGLDWEAGLGTYTAAGTLLARTAVYASSNAGSAVNWGAGTRTIVVGVLVNAAGEVVLGTVVIPPTAVSTTDGAVFHDMVQDKLGCFCNGLPGWFDKCIFSSYGEVTRTGVVASQSLFSATARGTRTLPANFWKPGKVLHYRLVGHYSTDSAPGNATIVINLGSTMFRTIGSFVLDNSLVGGYWTLEGEIVCESDGTNGSLQGQITWLHAESVGGGGLPLDSQPPTAVTPITYNTTQAGAFDVLWTATDAGTSITCTTQRLWEIC